MVVLILSGLIIMAYFHFINGYVWPEWTGFGDYMGLQTVGQRGKATWDWLQRLVAPGMLALAALFFNRQERKNELNIAIANRN
jgi:hypothetical protein